MFFDSPSIPNMILDAYYILKEIELEIMSQKKVTDIQAYSLQVSVAILAVVK